MRLWIAVATARPVAGNVSGEPITAPSGLPPGNDLAAMIQAEALHELHGRNEQWFHELTEPSTLWDLEAYIGPAGMSILMPVFGMARSGWTPAREAVAP